MSTISSRRDAADRLQQVLCESERPSLFFENLRKNDGLLPWFAEAAKLVGIPQNEKYHPEGDVWTHTMMVLDEAAGRRDRVSRPYAFMLTALTHDFGKIICTEVVNGQVHAYRHETEGIPLVKTFLERMEIPDADQDYICNLVELHMKPNMYALQQVSVKSTNKMFDQAQVPADLLQIAASDHFGKGNPENYTEISAFLQERLAAYYRIMSKPHVTEADLLDAGAAVHHLPELMAYARKLRLACVDKETALKQTIAFGRKMK